MFNMKWSLQSLENGLQSVEKFVNIITPRLLIVGFVISMVDLLTSGSLLNNLYMVYAWAIVQAMAVDATLPEMWRRAANHFNEVRKDNRWKPILAGASLAFIGVTLSVVVFYALAIQFLQQAEHISLLQSMTWLNVNPAIIAFIRAGSVVFLTAVLSVLNRTKTIASTEMQPKVSPNVPNIPEIESELTEIRPNIHRIPERTRELSTELHVVKSNESEKKRKVRELLEENPNYRTGELAKLAGVSPSYASDTRKQWLAERQEQAV